MASAILLEEIANNQPLALDNGIRWDSTGNGVRSNYGKPRPMKFWRVWKKMELSCHHGSKGVSFYKPTPNSAEWHMEGPQAQCPGTKEDHSEIPKKSICTTFKIPESNDKRVVQSSKNASLVDLGDGVACLHSIRR